MAEEDKDYAGYRNRMKPRLGLKERHIAEGYMRGSDPSWEHMPPEALPRVAGNVDIHILYGRANLSMSIETDMLDEMLAEWTDQLSQRADRDPRAFTKKVIREKIALNEHGGDLSLLLACGVVWFFQDGADPALWARLKQGDIELTFKITDDDVAKSTRVQTFIGEFET